MQSEGVGWVGAGAGGGFLLNRGLAAGEQQVHMCLSGSTAAALRTHLSNMILILEPMDRAWVLDR